ncbi:MAG: hypothetical protein R3C97_15880 [Geminicoccaceae bacterium]
MNTLMRSKPAAMHSGTRRKRSTHPNIMEAGKAIGVVSIFATAGMVMTL